MNKYSNNNIQNAVVKEVKERNKNEFVCTFIKKNNDYEVKVDNSKNYFKIILDNTKNLVNGNKILVKIDKYLDNETAKGHVKTIIGHVNDIDSDNLQLYDTYQSRNKEGKLEKNNLMNRVYVQVPYINVIKQYKELDEFSELELAIYILANGITDDIMKLKESKVIGIMKNKMERFNQDDELRLAAYNRELNIYAHEMELEENYQNGKAEGKAEGREEGIGIGKEEGIKIGKKEEKKNLTNQLFKSKYPNEDSSILNDLEIEVYDLIFKMLLEDQSLEKIKNVIKK